MYSNTHRAGCMSEKACDVQEFWDGVLLRQWECQCHPYIDIGAMNIACHHLSKR